MQLEQFKDNVNEWLEQLEYKRSKSTLATYRTALKHFYDFLESGNITEINPKSLYQYRSNLADKVKSEQIKPDTAKMRITAINMALNFMGKGKLKIEPLKSQNTYTDDNVITESDYNRLIKWADKLGMQREKLIMECLASSGCRIAELEAFTVEAIENAGNRNTKGEILVTNKGKTRKIFIPDKVRKDLLEYIENNNIESGVIFHGERPDRLLDKATIWRNLQRIAGRARVKKSKVHAHSFRHYFSRKFLNKYGDENILPLADLLGHSSLETTRRYTRKTSKEQKRIVEDLFKKES